MGWIGMEWIACLQLLCVVCFSMDCLVFGARNKLSI